MTKETKPLWRDNTYEILGGKAIIYTTLKSGGNYYVRMRLTLEKKYLRQSLRTSDLDTAVQRAEDFVLKTLSDIQSGKKMFGMTLGELADEYLEYRKDDIGLETGITEGRWKTIKTYINALLRYKTPQIKLSELDVDSCYEYLKWRNGDHPGISPISVRNEQATINHLMKYAFRNKHTHFEKFRFKEIKLRGGRDQRRRGLIFCNTPDYGTDEVSDTVLAMMLSLLRGVFAYDVFSRGYFDTWQENTIAKLRRISGLTLGVVGAGRIGTALMRKAKALGMNIMFYDPYKESGYEKAIGVSRCYILSEFLAQCDVVSMHTPLTSETRAMVDKNFIDSMKQGSILINSSRGEVVKDLDVVYKALKSEKLSAVALDVLPDEPPVDCELIRAWRSHDKELAHRIIINPHTSYYTQESYIEMRVKAAENAKRILDGIEPLNIIADGR